MDNRRIAPRQRSFLRGRIYFNNRRSSADCLIRDISDTGAKLTFSHAITTPEVIELHIPAKEMTLRAHVQWRRGEEIGVAFMADDAPTLAPAPAGDLAERVHHVEQELARLHRVVETLQSELNALRRVPQ